MELMEIFPMLLYGDHFLFFTKSLTVFHTKEVQIKKEETSVQLSL